MYGDIDFGSGYYGPQQQFPECPNCGGDDMIREDGYCMECGYQN